MKCPECGKWNRASLPHCTNCGMPLNIDAATRIEWKDKLKDGGQAKAYIRVDEFGQENREPDARDVLAQEMAELKKRKQEGEALLEHMHEQAAAAREAASQKEGGRSASPRRQSVHQSASSAGASVPQSAPKVNPAYRSASNASAASAVQSPPRQAAEWLPPGKGHTPLNPDTGWMEIPSDRTGSVRLRKLEPKVQESVDEGQRRSRIRYSDEHGDWLDPRNPAAKEPVWNQTIHTAPAYPALNREFHHKANKGKKLLKGLLITLLCLALCTGGYFTWRFFDERKQATQPDTTASVTASMLDDLAAHTILIPGEDGTTIYIRELHASYLVTEGFATVQVADHTWYDSYVGTLAATMDVTLTPFLKTASGKQTPLDPITYTIDIPLSPITLDSPDSLRTTVATTMSTIKITVRPGSKVTVNGVDCSDTVNSESGEMSYNATVQPIGNNTYNIVVKSKYCRENSLTVTLYREEQEIPLDLAVGTYGTTNESVMTVTATTLPGAYVEVLSSYADLDITDLDSTGKFTFKALFDEIGYNTIIITASYPGKKTSRVEHSVYYLPPASEYTVKAWPLSSDGYSELLSNINVRAARKQVYVITGVVQYSVSEKPQMVVINTSEDGKSQPVLVQNLTSTTWQVGTYYRLYGDAYSTYNGMPWLIVRYTYTK